jgi:hypothetical protein
MVVDESRYHPGIFLERLRKTVIKLRIGGDPAEIRRDYLPKKVYFMIAKLTFIVYFSILLHCCITRSLISVSNAAQIVNG